MRALLFGALIAAGLGLFGAGGAGAAPAAGIVIDTAASAIQTTVDVRWRGHGWGRHHWRGGHHWRGSHWGYRRHYWHRRHWR